MGVPGAALAGRPAVPAPVRRAHLAAAGRAREIDARTRARGRSAWAPACVRQSLSCSMAKRARESHTRAWGREGRWGQSARQCRQRLPSPRIAAASAVSWRYRMPLRGIIARVNPSTLADAAKCSLAGYWRSSPVAATRLAARARAVRAPPPSPPLTPVLHPSRRGACCSPLSCAHVRGGRCASAPARALPR